MLGMRLREECRSVEIWRDCLYYKCFFRRSTEALDAVANAAMKEQLQKLSALLFSHYADPQSRSRGLPLCVGGWEEVLLPQSRPHHT